MSTLTADSDKTVEYLLIQKAQAGDTQAFGELVLKYQRFVYNLALRSLGNAEEAQDAAQEAFLRAWRGLPGFHGNARFSTWLYRITANLCINRRPRLRRELSELSVEESVEAGLELPEQLPGPAKRLEKDELRALLHLSVDSLPDSYRMLIVLRYQQELAYSEIAEILGIPIGTVKTGLFRAKAQLRAALIAQEGIELESAI